jgi:hypothetical protein
MSGRLPPPIIGGGPLSPPIASIDIEVSFLTDLLQSSARRAERG